jgi:hypothetical protein
VSELALVWCAAAVAAGCGRIGFDLERVPQRDGADAPVASLVCDGHRAISGKLLATGQLAVATTPGGFYAAWTGTTELPATIVRLDAQLAETARQTLGALGPDLNGVLDLGTDVLAAYGNNALEIVDMYKLSSDLSLANYFATFVGLAGRGPFLANRSGSERGYLWSHSNTVVVSHMDELGLAGGGSTFDMTDAVGATSGDNGVDDGAVVWVETPAGGASHCTAGNVRFDTPDVPSLRSTRQISGDCRHARIAAGPTGDAWLVASITGGGVLEARYSTPRGDIVRMLSLSGRAPKVAFDGTQFWIAWLDNPAGEIGIAAVDLDGNLVVSAPPGRTAAGDEAFQLVRSGSIVLLAVLGADALDFVRLCR